MKNIERFEKQMAFIREIDKEKMIKRQSYLSDCETHEDDAQHAHHHVGGRRAPLAVDEHNAIEEHGRKSQRKYQINKQHEETIQCGSFVSKFFRFHN